MRLLLFVAFLSVASTVSAGACKSTSTLDMSPFSSAIGERKVVFVASNLKTGECWVSDANEARIRHAPWSTFKIPHFAIALETGAVESPEKTIRWDPTKYPAQSYWPKAWAQDQTLSSAFQRSSAWYFQELVPRIGVHNYQKWLDRFEYGNKKVPPGRDDFWLGGPLEISAAEQVQFLSCLATAGCGVSEKSLRALEAVALQDQRDGSRLYAKTGSGPELPGQFDGAFQGWYVGYVRDRNTTPLATFAIYVRSDSYLSLRTFRQDMAVRLLSHLNLWPR